MVASTREQALTSLFLCLKDGLTDISVLRNEALPTKIPAEGLVILRDGQVGEAEVILSPTRYIYQHQAEIEVLVQNSDQVSRDATLDSILQQIGNTITSAGTLGGLVDNIQLTAPEFINEVIEGAPAVKAAIVGVILEYVTTNPLN